MVRHYKRKTVDRYTRETLLEAIEEVRSKRMSLNRASTYFGVPRATLSERVKGKRGAKSNTRGRPTVLKPDLEKKFATIINTLLKHGFHLTTKETKSLVARYIKRFNIKTSFKNDVPGDDWIRGFKERNLIVTQSKLVQNGIARKTADPYVIYEFFDLYENIVKHQNLEGDQIWFLNENGYCTETVKHKEIKLKSFPLTSDPNSYNATVFFLCSSSGKKCVPLLVYKENNLESQATDFENYFTNIVIPELSKTDKQQLIIYNGNSTRFDLHVVREAMKNNIIIIKIPTNSSQTLQPFDFGITEAMNGCLNSKIDPEKKLSDKQLRDILLNTWNELDFIVIKDGFEKTGVFPLNRTKICEDIFDPEELMRWKDHIANKKDEVENMETEEGKELDSDLEELTVKIEKPDSDVEEIMFNPLQEDNDDDISAFFMQNNKRSRCVICRELVSKDEQQKHLTQQHPDALENLNESENNDVYTEVVYLEDDESLSIKKESNCDPSPSSQKRKRVIEDSSEKEIATSTENDELERFGSYIASLMRSLPKTICVKLQMNIINQVMAEKLKIQEKESNIEQDLEEQRESTSASSSSENTKSSYKYTIMENASILENV